MKHRRSAPKSSIPKRSAAPWSDGAAEARARKKLKKLWQIGDLVHFTDRYPHKPEARKIDRLAGILARGLLAPAHCPDGNVVSDLNITVTGCGVSYDSLIFLHRFTKVSYIYTLCEPGRFAVFLDPSIPVLTPEAMEEHWPLLCMDEVYVREPIGPEKLVGVAVHPADAAAIQSDLMPEFQGLEIPLYDYAGQVLWPSA